MHPFGHWLSFYFFVTFTLTVAVAFLWFLSPAAVTVILAVPFPFIVTLPFLFTVATLFFELL